MHFQLPLKHVSSTCPMVDFSSCEVSHQTLHPSAPTPLSNCRTHFGPAAYCSRMKGGIRDQHGRLIPDRLNVLRSAQLVRRAVFAARECKRSCIAAPPPAQVRRNQRARLEYARGAFNEGQMRCGAGGCIWIQISSTLTAHTNGGRGRRASFTLFEL